MAVVAGACQPFGRDGASLRTRSCLQDMEEREAYRLLDLRIALELDVCMCPEIVQVGPLLGEQVLPAGQACSGQRGPDLVVDGRPRPQARPAVGDELNDAQPLARLQPGGYGTRATSRELSDSMIVSCGPSIRWSIAAPMRRPLAR